MLFQISEEDVMRSSTLEDSDIGKWCYLVAGCYQGFFEEKSRAYESYNKVFDTSLNYTEE